MERGVSSGGRCRRRVAWDIRRCAQCVSLSSPTRAALQASCDEGPRVGHSAGGELALCLAAHEPSLKHVISLAGGVDLQQAWELHLGNDAVVDFLGGKPSQIGDHYREADPMQLSVPQTTRQWLIHGAEDDVVPAILSRNYTEQKKKRREDAHYLEISTAGHFDLIDPRSKAWPKIENTILQAFE